MTVDDAATLAVAELEGLLLAEGVVMVGKMPPPTGADDVDEELDEWASWAAMTMPATTTTTAPIAT
jgi:hypothetical protein